MLKFIQATHLAVSNAKRLFITSIVLFGAFALFAQLTSPIKIEVEPPEDKLIRQQQDFLEYYKTYQPTSEAEKKILEVSRDVYCAGFGMACNDNARTLSNENFDKSVVGRMGQLLATPYTNPPASTSYYVWHTLENAGFIPKSYAAEGLGFAGLAPFMQIWKKLRDIAFLIITLAIIISGFLIMFRGKMDPHSEIKLETALPKIIIAMILINFSFAIAGLLIDVMYVLSGLIIIIFGPLVSPNLSLSAMLDRFVSPSTGDLFHLVFANFDGSPLGIFGGIKRIMIDLPYAFYGIFGETYRTIILYIAGIPLAITGSIYTFKILSAMLPIPFQTPAIPAIITYIATIIVGLALFKLGTLLPLIVLGVFFMITAIYIFFQLFGLTFKAYIKVLFYVVLSPLILVGEALPGSNVFVPWAQTLFVELLTFPLILLVFLLSGALTHAVSNGQALGLPFVVAVNPDGLGLIISFGILFLMPEFVKTIKEKLNTQSMSVPALGPGMFFKGTEGTIKSVVNKRNSLYFLNEVFNEKTNWRVALKKIGFGAASRSTSH